MPAGSPLTDRLAARPAGLLLATRVPWLSSSSTERSRFVPFSTQLLLVMASLTLAK